MTRAHTYDTLVHFQPYIKPLMFKGELIFVEEPFICDNSIQCDDGADETGCDGEYIRKKIFTINDKHRCNSVYLNFTRADVSTGRFYPQRGIRRMNANSNLFSYFLFADATGWSSAHVETMRTDVNSSLLLSMG